MNNKSSLILAIGFIISAFILGNYFVSARNEQSIRVVGQGVKSVTSDLIKWNMSINRTTMLLIKVKVPPGYRKI